tara:strand:- start:700 stop:1011 length:312 start_codon:yes stop_codon:yes gene_type:complete
MPINIVVKPADPKTEKRFTAIFRIHKGGKVIKITNFGQRNPKKGTYIDHGDKKLRSAYRARHKKDLDTKDFKRAGYLSYYLLWGDQTTLKKNLEDYRKRFKLS